MRQDDFAAIMGAGTALKLIDEAIKSQGLEMTLEQIRKVTNLNSTEVGIPWEEAWRSMMASIVWANSMQEKYKQEKEDSKDDSII